MDVRSDQSFWQSKHGNLQSYPSLTQDETCDVVVIGGGITGALVAQNFSRHNVKTIVVEKDKMAHGSTSVSTALLQYEIDEPLYRLQAKIGKQKATLAYKLCADSIADIERITKELGNSCGFEYRPSLYFAIKDEDVSELEQEYTARKDAGFDVSLLSGEEIFARCNFKASVAIESQIGGQIDPYLFTYKLFDDVTTHGGRIFENTQITHIDPVLDGVVAVSKEGHRIHAKKVVVSVGYQANTFLREKTAHLHSTFACVSTPIDPSLFWPNRSLLWNTDDPYFYARITSDNRIMIGGEDVEYVDDLIRDKFIPIKEKILVETFHSLFPHIPFEIAYAWAGTFGETKDALPYIGISPEYANTYFALGYGGNGITFSVIASQLLLDLYQGKISDALELFRFGR